MESAAFKKLTEQLTEIVQYVPKKTMYEELVNTPL